MTQSRNERTKREPKREAKPSYAADVSSFTSSYVAVLASDSSKFSRRAQQILLHAVDCMRRSDLHSVALVRDESNDAQDLK